MSNQPRRRLASTGENPYKLVRCPSCKTKRAARMTILSDGKFRIFCTKCKLSDTRRVITETKRKDKVTAEVEENRASLVASVITIMLVLVVVAVILFFAINMDWPW